MIFVNIIMSMLALTVYILTLAHEFGMTDAATKMTQEQPAGKPEVTLVIAVGTAPGNIHLRQAHRQTWATPSEQGAVKVFYFTDKTESTMQEASQHDDLVLMDVVGGHTNFLERFDSQVKWLQERYMFDYFLRVDDDGFLCIDQLMVDLKVLPKSGLFWGKYFCEEGRVVADENFMLFSVDVIHLLINSLFRRQGHATFAAHFGLWQHVLNLTIVDDRARIDAQQGYLTTFMHKRTASETDKQSCTDFCSKYIWAHHVHDAQVIYWAYEGMKEMKESGKQIQEHVQRDSVCGGRHFNSLFDPATTSLGSRSGFPSVSA